MIETIKNLGLSVGKAALIAFTMICALFALLAFLRIGLIYGIYTMVEDWTAVRLGFDYYVSNLLATAFTSIFTLLLQMLAWFFFLGKRQVWGIGTTVGVQLLICIAIYTIGSGVCFDRRTGKALCYYADTQKGRIWSYTPGYEPISGKEFRLYTREIKEAEDSRNAASKPQPSPTQSRIAPISSTTPVYGNVGQTVSPPVSHKQETVPVKNITPRIEPVRETKEVVRQTENTTPHNSFDRELELEKIRQAEETRRQQILERERRNAQERERREAENYRLRLEQERLELERKGEQERLAREERERQIAIEREEQRRREEKERRKQETFKTIANIAQPVIERLTRRKN
ncbi:MAG TPA: hypothetical protein VF648_05850 [Pyrinomonadaceae bacterium]|jgi:hypothetical protein